MAAWYRRNLMIYANLHRIGISAGDRLLIIFGAGHIPLLRDFVTKSPTFCLVEPLTYLSAGGVAPVAGPTEPSGAAP